MLYLYIYIYIYIYRIDANGVIKVADFGLAEDVYTANYYRWKKGDTNMKFPVRWMSPESTRDGIFTEKSDVVSTSIELLVVVIMIVYWITCAASSY